MKGQDEVLLNYCSRWQYNQLIPNAKNARCPLIMWVNALIQSQSIFPLNYQTCREAGDHMTNTQSCENRSIIFLHPKAAAGTIWGFSPYFYVILKI